MSDPTIGALIYIWKRHARYQSPEPEAAIITHVNEDGTINVKGFTHEGGDFVMHSLPLRKDNDPEVETAHAQWPDQKWAKKEPPPADGDFTTDNMKFRGTERYSKPDGDIDDVKRMASAGEPLIPITPPTPTPINEEPPKWSKKRWTPPAEPTPPTTT